MINIRIFKTAGRGLTRNVMRAILTTLGIVIGIAAVITMMEIGQGSSAAIQRSIASMGANNLMIMPGQATSGGVSFGAGTTMTLTPGDVEAISADCPSVRAAAPLVRSRVQIVYSNKNWVPQQIYGTTPDYLKVRDWTEMAEGDAFTDKDVRNASKVCLLGQTEVTQLFGEQSPIGKEIRLQNVAFKVVGVLSRKGANMMGMDQDDIVLAPWTTIKYRVSNSSLTNTNQSAASSSASSISTAVNTLSNLYPETSSSLYDTLSNVQQADTPLPIRFTNVDTIMAAAGSTEEIPDAISEITQLLRQRHRTKDKDPEDFQVRDMTEISKVFSSTSEHMTSLLLYVALISLIVGGVGIMNIMLVSVTERTKEIGLRMAVGARAFDILEQFLIEAVLLCLVGGIFGIGLGELSSWIVRHLPHPLPTETSVWAMVISVIVSVVVGFVFGMYPAWKASRLDPIDALRYE